MHTRHRSSWVVAGWIAALAIIVLVSVAMGAHASTTAFLVALGIAPALVAALVIGSTPSATVAEILHAVQPKDGRS